MPGRRWSHTTSESNVTARWIRSTPYGSSLGKRLVGMVVFALLLLRPGATRGLPKPDVVLGSTVHPFAAWAGWRLARRHRVPFVYEIRDVWPDTLVDMGKLSATNPLAVFLRWLSRSLCRHASLVISPLPHVDEYVRDLGVADRRFLWLSNGVEVDPRVRDEPIETGTGDGFTFMYLGSHGNANAIDLILDAFAKVTASRPDAKLRLRIVGDGPLTEDLKRHAAALPCRDAISFEGRIPRDQVGGRAAEADCLVAVSRDHAVYRYGSSPNKLFDYLLAGKPIVRASNAKVNPIDEAGAGIVVPAGDVDAIAQAMGEIYELGPEERARMGRSGRATVIDRYSYEALARRLAVALGEVAYSTSKGSAHGS